MMRELIYSECQRADPGFVEILRGRNGKPACECPQRPTRKLSGQHALISEGGRWVLNFMTLEILLKMIVTEDPAKMKTELSPLEY